MQKNEYRPELGKAIKMYRTLFGVTAQQLADDLGITRASVVKIEQGHVSARSLALIEKVLNTSADALEEWTGVSYGVFNEQ